MVAILECDPDLGDGLTAEQLARARRTVMVPLRCYARGRWRFATGDFEDAASVGMLITRGFLAREMTVAGYTSAELLGPGDVVQPLLGAVVDQSVVIDVTWTVVQALRAAVLDRGFLSSVSNWPEITAAIIRRGMQRSHWLEFQLAISALRRVDDRLWLALWHFADRWGIVTLDGVQLDIPLTHDLLASVVGARRPSVSAAVSRLIEQQRLRTRPRSRWLLLGEPPAELLRWLGESGRGDNDTD